MSEMPLRQVHLDFHTSPLIPDVGRDFDEEAFVQTLLRAHVASVTCFSRCHHGHIYHPTRFSELRHPHLCGDLLGRQIAACHAAGIRAPVYITVGWDHLQSRRNPQWLERHADGRTPGPGPLEPGFNQKLCLNSGYVDFVCDQTAEVLERYPCDGFFFDIVGQGPCVCPACLDGMHDLGLDPERDDHRLRHAGLVLDQFKERVSALVRAAAPDASIFYNAGHIGPETFRTLDTVTHLELESLPTGHWGYLHFPVTARHARVRALPTVGMTAAFFGPWGDVSSFKPRAALQYECFSMLGHGAGCSVGDQLHPLGTLNRATYDLIGGVFGQVKAREPWCVESENISEIAVLHPEGFDAADGLVDRSAAGAELMLSEGHHLFDFVDGGCDLSPYAVVVVPDKIRLGPELADTLQQHLDRGGALIASHLSGLKPNDDTFALDAIGADCAGMSEHDPDFLRPGPQLAEGLPPSELVMYSRPVKVCPHQGTEVLATALRPYFNRTYRHFHSHRHAPVAGPAGYPAIIRRGRVIYFAHKIFELYRRKGAPWCRDLLLGAVDLLLPQPLLRTDAPPSCAVTLRRQPHRNRWVLHLWHYIPRATSEAFLVVDRATPLSNITLRVRTQHRPTRVVAAPDGRDLPFTHHAPYTEVTLPHLDGHRMVVLDGLD